MGQIEKDKRRCRKCRVSPLINKVPRKKQEAGRVGEAAKVMG